MATGDENNKATTGPRGEKGERGEKGVRGEQGPAIDAVGRSEFEGLCKRIDNHILHIDQTNSDINTRLSKVEGGISTLKWMVGIGLSATGVAIAAVGALSVAR